MRIDLAAKTPPDVVCLGDYVQSVPGGYRVRGSDQNDPIVYVRMDGDTLWVGSDFESLEALVAEALPRLSDLGISCFLHYGLVPSPLSVLEGLATLTTGDTFDITRDGSDRRIRQNIEFRYFSSSSTQKSHASTTELLSRLTQAVERSLNGRQAPVLLLSSGKDSVSIALALAELGCRDAECVTFVSTDADDESEYAQSVARKLGLKHRIVRMSLDPSANSMSLGEYFQGSPLPCGDPAVLGYIACLNEIAGEGRAVLDGTGNDMPFGVLPRPQDRVKLRAPLGRFGVGWAMERVAPFYSPLSFLAKGRAECLLPGYYLRGRETKHILKAPQDTAPVRRMLDANFEALSAWDLRQVITAKYFDPQMAMLKARTASYAFGARASFPWCDPDLAGYIFGLPENARFDAASLTNKVLLRRLLRERLGYPDRMIGKRGFGVDLQAFYGAFSANAISEVARCSLYRPKAVAMLERWLGALAYNPRFGYAIHATHMLAGWHNHSRTLAGRR